MSTRPDPVQQADAEARTLARQLLDGATHAALAVTDPLDGSPGISRIAFGRAPDGGFLTLVSALAPHHGALKANPACALMVGDPGDKGDPLTHPRLMIKARAEFVSPDDPARATLRTHWLTHQPKAKLYVDFADFAFVRFTPVSALLNGGFARAFRLTPEDL
jgi:putative heme iron utilization protein